jgi:hypothetical protein
LTARAAAAVRRFLALVEEMSAATEELALHERVERVIEHSGLIEHFKKDKGEQGQSRVENLAELVNAARGFVYSEDEHGDMTPLDAFLAHAVLESGEGQGAAWEDCVQMMTLHSAKGLEFPLVFLCGMEDGLFPHQMSLDEPGRLEEERRLCYVGITRARQQLVLTCAERRRMFGTDRYNLPSQFLGELPDDLVEEMEAINNPEDPSYGTRKVPFCREIYIERTDFMEEPPKKFYRMAPGREVRLRYAYIVKCTGFEKDPETGEITEIRCTYDPETRGGNTPDGRKVRGTIHWVSARHAFTAQVRQYERLFREPYPGSGGADFMDSLNPDSLEILDGCLLEPSLKEAEPGSMWQFERLGYFCVDTRYSEPGAPVFNRTVQLRDTWAKIEKRLAQQQGGSKAKKKR